MAKSKTNERKNGTVQLKHVVEKLQKSLHLSKRSAAIGHNHHREDIDEVGGHRTIPEDVKEGHFAVLAVDDGRSKRFVIALRYLNHPQFLRLLEQAAEEFGFNQEGALAIPCRPSELERILAEHWMEETDGNGGDGWDGYKTIVESC
ncbi:auxin-responsive protein SAUR50-like [Magnolia sinica]|uniref:auxin-responsive protein SAUR50-like n=1 Tax=Magnolia sinica TaxID=86752 RepID=UPI00265A9200|nr:auxin-responsive protein SAUR50-like [Magnolia sinica]